MPTRRLVTALAVMLFGTFGVGIVTAINRAGDDGSPSAGGGTPTPTFSTPTESPTGAPTDAPSESPTPSPTPSPGATGGTNSPGPGGTPVPGATGTGAPHMPRTGGSAALPLGALALTGAALVAVGAARRA